MKKTFFQWRLSAAFCLSASFIPAALAVADEPVQVAAVPVDPAAPAEVAAEQRVSAAPIVETEASPVKSSSTAELVQERHANGAIKIEREMTLDAAGNYILHGAWRYYDDKGKLLIDGRFVQGERDGLWRRFYRGDEAALLSTAPYKEFARPLISAATFQHGQLQGTWKITDGQHRLVHEITFQEAARHGKATWYYPSGSVFLRANYVNGLVNGEVAHYSADGNVAERETFDNGQKIAAEIEYYDAARQVKKQEITFLYPTMTVKSPDVWETCTLASVDSQGEPVRHGPFFMWHANGQLARQSEYRNGAVVGKLVAWHQNGQKQVEGQYENGHLAGSWTWWHANGQKASSGEYSEGQPTGSWIWWKSNGELAQRTDLTPDRGSVVAVPTDSLEPLRTAEAPTDPNAVRR